MGSAFPFSEGNNRETNLSLLLEVIRENVWSRPAQISTNRGIKYIEAAISVLPHSIQEM